ncbi:hypothetical protein A2U01_0020855 [Trifolium medium]|uniref:Uncharacterized protein n=1 Tax=Trifolium medium TaxID=97028 RepID=A0A392NJ42_9FABA|nr:hypothetical protein [Trifolium medium]
MTDDEVGRTRRGKASKAHSSARREAAVNVDKIPRQAKGKAVATTTDEPQHEPEPQSEHEDEELQEEPEHDAEHEDEDEELQDEFGDEDEEENFSEEVEEEEEYEQPPPEPKKPRKKLTRVTQGKNPPQVKTPPVTCYDGGPTDLSLLSGFGKHVVVSLWKGECKNRYLRIMNNGKKINDFQHI